MKDEMKTIKSIIETIPELDHLDIYTCMSNVLRMIMFKIRDIRQIELKERRRLINYDKLNPDPNFRAAAKSACKTQIYECKIFVHKALQLNLHICECLAKMQNNESVMRTGNINISTQMNVGDYSVQNMYQDTLTFRKVPTSLNKEVSSGRNFARKVTSPEVLPTMQLDSGDSVK